MFGTAPEEILPALSVTLDKLEDFMEQLETMRDFFNTRAEIYDTQQLLNIDGGDACYRAAADFLPPDAGTLLDLGCGTGLELAAVFARFPAMRVTGIDLAEKMLEKLREKYAGRPLELICGSYFSTEFGENCFDAALSIMSLHHFEAEAKTELYRRILRALRPGGAFLEGDYLLAENDPAQEAALLAEGRRLREARGRDGEFYHFDTPFTVRHETELLLAAGFSSVRRVWGVGNNVMLLAEK